MTVGVINPYRFVTAPAGKSVTYLQHSGDTTDLTTYTFTAANLGTADAGRYIICGVSARCSAATAFSVSSVTIGGVAATAIVQANAAASNGSLAAIFVAAVPTGTSGDVVVVLNQAGVRCGIDLWSAAGITTTAHDSDSSTADPGVKTLDTTASGFLVAVSTAGGTPTYAWTNASERYDGVIAGAEGSRCSTADTTTSAGTLAVTADPSGGSVVEVATVFASW